jgi:formate/nitrite transporter FocA (FNT family)
MSYLVWQGEAFSYEYLFNFLIPTTIGNIIMVQACLPLIYGQ